MRGGLDDALDKLARRDELRRRAAGEPPGTPPAVTELMESIAAVVAHHPTLGVTVGVEGAGEPLLLHFHFGDGQVQVNAENAIGAHPAEEAMATPRHADFEIDLDEEPVPAPRATHGDQDNFATATSGYGGEQVYVEPETVERPYEAFAAPTSAPDPRYATPGPGESSQDLGARMRDLGMASSRQHGNYPPHPFAATPPPEVPLQVPSQPAAAMPPPPRPTVPMQPDRGRPDRGMPDRGMPDRGMPDRGMPDRGMPDRGMPDRGQRDRDRADYAQPGYAEATRRINPEQYRAPAEPSAAERIPMQSSVHPVSPQPRGSYPVNTPPDEPYSVGVPYAGSSRSESAQPGSGYPAGAQPAAAPPGYGDPNGVRSQPAGMPKPLAKPIPLQVERPEETEMAARRVAALLRDDPSLLSQPPN